MITIEKLDRHEQTIRVRRALLEEGHTKETLAEKAGLTLATVSNVINGGCAARKARRTLTEIIGVELWPGLPPSPQAQALRQVRRALAALREVWQQFDENAAPDAEMNLAAVRKYRAVVDDPDLPPAIAQAGARLSLATVGEFSALLQQPDFDKLFGLKRAADDPRKIIIGGAA